MKDTKITMDEILKEMEQFRGNHTCEREFTDEQIKFLKAGRSGNAVPYPKLVLLWNKMNWGQETAGNLQRIHTKLKSRGKL